MVKNPFPSMEIFQTNGTEQMATKVIFPNGFNLVNSKQMHRKLLFRWCHERATIKTTNKGSWLLGRAVGCGRRAIAIGKTSSSILFDFNPKRLAIGPNIAAPILK